MDMDAESPALVLEKEQSSHDDVTRLISLKHTPSPIKVGNSQATPMAVNYMAMYHGPSIFPTRALPLPGST